MAEPTGNGGGTGAAGEMGRGGGGEEGAVGDVGGDKGGGGGCGGGCRGREERSIRARLEDLKLWTACCRAPGSLGALFFNRGRQALVCPTSTKGCKRTPSSWPPTPFL